MDDKKKRNSDAFGPPLGGLADMGGNFRLWARVERCVLI